MLQQVCEYLNNYFVYKPNPGEYTISGGAVSPDVALLEGQRFWIYGSAMNNGVYTWHEDGIKDDDDNEAVTLMDETFTGNICALAVPKEVVAIANEISGWVEQYADVLNSPYSSENVIGVYSYTKAKGGGDGSDSGDVTWQSKFGDRLSRWRKIAL